ncbi:MAG: hypothetical protein D6730_22240 [Bacteroidetes bacterium]|nr:MAG: hypothetical protein D6730_22240 [Bacteroidota bacterium]
MYTGLLHTHKLVVTLFFLLYLGKIILLLLNKTELLDKLSKKLRIPEMVISVLFLLTGVVMIFQVAEVTPLMIVKLVLVFASIPIAIRGFKQHHKLLASLAVLMIIAAYGLSEMNKIGVDSTPLPETVITDPAQANYDLSAHGKAIYERNCIVCHGEDGKKRASGAKDLTVTQLDEAAIEQLILKGKNAMPGYEKVLNQQEIKAVMAYVKGFKQGS